MPIQGSVTAPPRKTASPKTASRKTAEREEGIAGLFQIVQGGLIVGRQLADASALGMHGEKIAHELSVLADSEAAIAKIIDPLIKVGPYTALIAAILPLAAQIGVNHKMVPPGTLGTVSGDLLEGQMRLAIQKQELAVQHEQAEIARQMEAMQAEYMGFTAETGHGSDD